MNVIIVGIATSLIASFLFFHSVKFLQIREATKKYNRLKGKYQVLLKKRIGDPPNDPIVFEEQDASVIIEKVIGSNLIVLFESKTSTNAKGVIKMSNETPGYGEGFYQHVLLSNGWGIWKIQIAINQKDILVNTEYIKEGKALHYAYLWKRINN